MLRHDVASMEDYAATPAYPLHKCLADVAGCEVYVGLIGCRYGYVPGQDNPDGKSITELEYRRAGDSGKPPLLFLADPAADWPDEFKDSHTGEGEAGARIAAFRGELAAKRAFGILKGHTGEGLFRHLEVEFAAWERGDAMALLRKVGAHLNATAGGADFGSLSQNIGETLCGTLSSGSAALIECRFECRCCDGLFTDADVFRDFVLDYWGALVRAFTPVATKHQEVRIVLLLLVEGELADNLLAADCCCDMDGCRKERLLEVQLDEWTSHDIGTWLGRHSGRPELNGDQIDCWAEQLYRANSGIPLMIADALLNQCCSS